MTGRLCLLVLATLLVAVALVPATVARAQGPHEVCAIPLPAGEIVVSWDLPADYVGWGRNCSQYVYATGESPLAGPSLRKGVGFDWGPGTPKEAAHALVGDYGMDRGPIVAEGSLTVGGFEGYSVELRNLLRGDADTYSIDMRVVVRVASGGGPGLPPQLEPGSSGYVYINVLSSLEVSDGEELFLESGESVADWHQRGFDAILGSLTVSVPPLAATPTPEPTPTPAPTHLVGYWKFDEGSGTTTHDSSSYGNDGEIHNASWVSGVAGQALLFDGTDDSYVEVPSKPELTPTTRLVIDAWIKAEINDWFYGSPHWAIVYKGDSEQTGCFVGYEAQQRGSTYSLWVGSDGGLDFMWTPEGQNCQTPYRTDSGLIPRGQWTHLRVDLNTTEGWLRIFVNDENVFEDVVPTKPPKARDSPLWIGGMSRPPYEQSGSNFTVSIDEVRIGAGDDEGVSKEEAGPPQSNFVASVPAPDEISTDPEVIGSNIFLTLLIVFAFAFTSSLFNQTLEENRRKIEGWLARYFAPLQRFGRLVELQYEAVAERRPWVQRAAGPGVILVLSGFIYSFLSPDFGFNTKGLVLFASLLVGAGAITYVYKGGQVFFTTRRLRLRARVGLYVVALAIAAASMVLSRLVDFQPGFLLGFVASYTLLAPGVLDRRQSGQLVLFPSIALLALSIIAWLLVIPLREVTEGTDAWWAAFPEGAAVAVFVAGLEGLFFNMIPLSFMDGLKILRWNRFLWFVMFGAAAFLFWHVLLNQEGAYADALPERKVTAALSLLALYSIATVCTWAYFRRRNRKLSPATPQSLC